VNGAKIAALGLRVKHGCTYHGLALNVDMDLRPFAAINPCGYPGLAVTDCRELGAALTVADAGQSLVEALRHRIESGSDCRRIIRCLAGSARRVAHHQPHQRRLPVGAVFSNSARSRLLQWQFERTFRRVEHQYFACDQRPRRPGR